jgi:hypothetical protein
LGRSDYNEPFAAAGSDVRLNTPPDKSAKLSAMSWVSLQTSTGPEDYQVTDLDEVVWWKTENGIVAVGYMDEVSGLMSENDLETCRVKRPNIVREIQEQQEPLKA